MEQGKLDIYKSKKGKWIVEVLFQNNGKEKKMPVQGISVSDDSLNGKEAVLEWKGGQIVSLRCEGKELMQQKNRNPSRGGMGKAPYQAPKGKYAQRDSRREVAQREPAWAPYNFVPLNERVVEAEDLLPFDTYHEGRRTGFIDLEMETKTPLYIRDTMNPKDAHWNSEDKNAPKNPDFFSPGGRIRIPGSSLRGMIRTLVEVVSFGKFGFFNDTKLNFRAVADTSTLGAAYKKVMVDENNNYFPKIKAGLLEKSGGGYRIHPSVMSENTQIYRVNFDKRTKIIAGTSNFSLLEFSSQKVFFKAVSPANHRHTKPNGKNHFLRYALLESISTIKDEKHPDMGYIVASGPFGRKKHMHWVINQPIEENGFLKIDDSVIKDYREDTNRDERADLLKEIEKTGSQVPCFYVTDTKNDVVSFGHTGMFRLAYEKTIGEHIPDHLKAKDKIDIAGAIFGNELKFAGRVFFEDAFLCEGQTNVLMTEAVPRILSTPKPTTFQHYLQQKGDNIKQLCHYNDDMPIRGNKFYWHKSGGDNSWKETDTQKMRAHEKQYTRIKPVKPGTKFKGCIRFENLSDIELGALLFSLELPEGCLHKLGMGKPLGLGSLHIAPVLHLSDRKKRYENLFFEWNNDIGASNKVSAFKAAFESYVLPVIGGSRGESLWGMGRLKELECLLNYDKGIALEQAGKTRYMTIEPNKFKDRSVLPKPRAV